MKLIFVTGNANKFSLAQTVCQERGFDIEQVVADIDEIQGEDPEVIVKDKARKAYELVGKPVIVSDDSWSIAALNGFPGPYMKSMSYWFEPQDFINLLRDKTDRTGMIMQFLAYCDGLETVVFRKDQPGTFPTEVRGNSKTVIHNVFCADSDNGKSLAELETEGTLYSAKRMATNPEPWTDLLDWLQEKQS